VRTIRGYGAGDERHDRGFYKQIRAFSKRRSVRVGRIVGRIVGHYFSKNSMSGLSTQHCQIRHDGPMATARYDIRPHGNRWMVFDTMTGSPATVNGVWQVDLCLEDADDLADALSYLHAKKLALQEN
jgi:hypothetical protein